MAKNNSFYKMDMLLLGALKTKDCYGYEMVKIIFELSGGLVKIKEGDNVSYSLFSIRKKLYIQS